VRQDFQALIKQWWSDIGVETELKNIDASVFFGGDPASPDTFQKFYADVEMYANNFDGTDPEQYLGQYTCEKAPRPETQWQGENINRFCNEEYDALVAELGKTGEISKRAEIAKKLNDMITKDTMTIVPLVDRGRVSAHSNSLGGVVLNTWDSELWNARTGTASSKLQHGWSRIQVGPVLSHCAYIKDNAAEPRRRPC
jgi:peptide/nickel transport system substrate-binding protein